MPQDGIDGCQETTTQSERRTGRREREPVQGEERGNRKVREEKRKNEEERGNQRMREEKRKKMKREEREKEI